MSFNYVALDSSPKTFDAVFHDPDTANKHNADSTPVFNVFEDANDTPILLNQSMTQRGGFVGCYRGTFAPSTANGFEVGKSYNVHVYGTVTGTVSGNAISDDWVASTFCVSVAEVVQGSVPATVAGSVASVVGDVGGNVIGSVGSVITITNIIAGVFAHAFSAAYRSFTFEQMIGAMAASLLGKLSGAATSAVVIRNLQDSGDVVTATVDANGNRTAVTVTP
jgi:hypothetical protein